MTNKSVLCKTREQTWTLLTLITPKGSKIPQCSQHRLRSAEQVPGCSLHGHSALLLKKFPSLWGTPTPRSLQLSSFSTHFQSPNLSLTKIMLKTRCQTSAPNPIKRCLDRAQVNTPATGCWLFWDGSFFLFMFCFLNCSVTNLKQMSKPFVFLYARYFFVSEQPGSQCRSERSKDHFCFIPIDLCLPVTNRSRKLTISFYMHWNKNQLTSLKWISRQHGRQWHHATRFGFGDLWITAFTAFRRQRICIEVNRKSTMLPWSSSLP